MNTLVFDSDAIEAAKENARRKQRDAARLEMHRLRDITKAAQHRLRRAYYLRLKELAVPSFADHGIAAKVTQLLAVHPSPQLAIVLEEYCALREQHAAAQSAFTHAAERLKSVTAARALTELTADVAAAAMSAPTLLGFQAMR